MKTRFFQVVGLAFVVAWVSLTAAGMAVPWLVNYQGVLIDQSTGQGVTATVTVTFRIFDAEVVGNLLWEETQDVQVDNGSFQVMLGSTQAGGTLDPAIFRTEPLWMEQWVDGEPGPMTPRLQMTSTPFAMRAWEAETAAVETDPTVAASVKDGVAWSELSGIPSGFADGVDNDAGGDITGVTAGTGLVGGATSGNASISVNTAVIQRRVFNGCPPGESIRIINIDGTIGCEPDDIGITAETDPQVGTNATGYVPRFNGSALVSGAIYDNGSTIGIGTSAPSSILEIEAFNPLVTLDTTNVLAGLRFQQNAATQWQMAWNADSHYLYFWGSGAGTSLVIQDGTGNVGIGTTTPTRELDVNGSLSARSGYGDAIILGGDPTGNDVEIGIQAPAERNTVSFWNHQTQTFADIHTREAMVTVLHITSDAKFKKEVRTIGDALDKVSRLRGVEFEWRRDEFPQRGFGEGKQVGLIAQEVEAVMPELVADGGGGKSVEYPNLVAVLIEAVKELKAQNDALHERVDALEASRWMARGSRE